MATKRTIEVTIISGEGLQANRFKPVKKNAFVVVKIDTGSIKATVMDAKGRSFPVWNEKLTMKFPLDATLSKNHRSTGKKIAMKRTIEVIIISEEGLQANQFKPLKKNAFVIMKTDTGRIKATAMDAKCGSFPVWNEKLTMEFPQNARSIMLEVNRKGKTGFVKLVGAATIPVSDFSGGSLSKNHRTFLSYRLRDSHGENNGVVNLSVQVKGEVEENVGRAWRPSAPSFDGAPVALPALVFLTAPSYPY